MVAQVYESIQSGGRERGVWHLAPGEHPKRREHGRPTWPPGAAVPGYVDYLAPQLYYSFENQALPYQQALEKWVALPRHPGLKLYAGLALYKAGTDADGGTWLSRDDIIALQAEAALQSGCQGVLLYSWEAFNSQQAAKELENAVALLGQY